MSYYDEPTTIFNARIASERSAIVDLKYTYKKIVTSLVTLNPEEISDELIQKQLDIIQQLRERRTNISNLENQLMLISETTNVVTEPVVDLSNNVVTEPVVDASNNVLPPEPAPEPALEPVPEPVPTDLSNNEVPT